MWTRQAFLTAGLLLAALPAVAAEETPMSAIDWLSNTVATPPVPAAPSSVAEPPVTKSAMPEQISVTPLSRPKPDAVGLIPASATGLPDDLWGSTSASDISARIAVESRDMLPAMRELLMTLLLAELDPPVDADGSATLLLARIDKLLELGALEQAEALLERAGPSQPALFRRWFDVALLTGREDRACAVMRATPDLSPTFPARIFCLARGGDWNAAALTLETGRALGYIDDDDDALLERFLHAELAEGAVPLPIPSRPSPLVFRIYEAIGEGLSTTTLPLAFAQADLRWTAGWKAQVEAAERLAQTGAIPENRLLGLYTERKPAASGGVWDRVEAIQRLDVALRAADTDHVNETLPAAWDAMRQAELEVPFASLFADSLLRLPLSGKSRSIALRIGLLSEEYERIAAGAAPSDDEEKFLVGLARGDVADLTAPDPFSEAVKTGFSRDEVPVRLQSLVESDRLGEAMLRGIELMTSGSRGELDEISDAIAFFRAVGLEDTARRAALQLLILDRRG